MPVDVIMPQMGESIAEGTLTVWFKKEGDRVKRDENLFEISTDKVDAEIPSPAAGTLGMILVHEGETVEVGTVVARILGEGEVATPGKEQAGETGETAATAMKEEEGREASRPAAAQADGAPVSRGQPAPAPAAAEAVRAEDGDGRGGGMPGERGSRPKPSFERRAPPRSSGTSPPSTASISRPSPAQGSRAA